MNPVCAEPTSGTDDAKTCPSCNASLTLRERYRSLRLLGQGGFGRTFLAVDESESSKPRCVVKQLFPQQQNERQRASRLFRQEAQRLRSLEAHSQIPDLIDYFEIDNQQYLVQEFIDGKDLAVALKSDKTSSPEAVVELLGSLLPVLQFMHEHQVIHRDIKPANIIRRDRDQQLFLVDLGAAKVATGTALVRTGTMIGSAEYTAPEQLRGKAVFASDIYSLGMTCLHLLTGVSPFNLYNADEGRLVWQDYLKAPIDKRLSQVLARMTTVATRQRYGSAREVLQELKGFSVLRTITDPVSLSKPLSPSVSKQSLIKAFTPANRHTLKSGSLEHSTLKDEFKTIPVKLQSDLQETPPLRFIQGSSPPVKSSLQERENAYLSENFMRLSVQVVLTLMLGTFTLLMLGMPAWIESAEKQRKVEPRPSLGLRAGTLQNVANQSSTENAYELFMQDSALINELGNKYGILPPQPVTATFPEQAPIEGTVDLSGATPLGSIAITQKYPISFELNEAYNLLLVQTLSSSVQAGESNVSAEVIDVETQQMISTVDFQGYLPPSIVFSGDGDMLISQSIPSPQEFSHTSLPEIKAWNWRTGNSMQKNLVNQNLFLGAAGPTLDSGEPSIVGNNMENELIVFGQETGRVVMREFFDGGAFGAQSYRSLIAAGTAEITGRDQIRVTIFDVNNQSKSNSSTIFPSLFAEYERRPGSQGNLMDVSLKFDSSGTLYIGREALECLISCLEIYELHDSKPLYKHIPAQIPPFHELFLGKETNQIVLYMPAYLGADAQLQVWDIAAGILVKRILLSKPYSVTLTHGNTREYAPPVKLSTDGTRLYTAHPGEIKVWDFQALLELE